MKNKIKIIIIILFVFTLGNATGFGLSYFAFPKKETQIIENTKVVEKVKYEYLNNNKENLSLQTYNFAYELVGSLVIWGNNSVNNPKVVSINGLEITTSDSNSGGHSKATLATKSIDSLYNLLDKYRDKELNYFPDNFYNKFDLCIADLKKNENDKFPDSCKFLGDIEIKNTTFSSD